MHVQNMEHVLAHYCRKIRLKIAIAQSQAIEYDTKHCKDAGITAVRTKGGALVWVHPHGEKAWLWLGSAI